MHLGHSFGELNVLTKDYFHKFGLSVKLKFSGIGILWVTVKFEF